MTSYICILKISFPTNLKMDLKSLVVANIVQYYILLTKMTFVLLSDVTLNTDDEFVYRDTQYGKIKGFVSERVPGDKVEQFLGVPFAAPPVGNLRLERPISPTPWSGTLDTLAIKAACLQKVGEKGPLDYIHQHVPDFFLEEEDCLYLNLYKPKKPSKSGYPVLLFIHGGSNDVGMGAMFDGDVIAGFSEIIVITFNYRLGALGFYGAKEENLEGNYGFLDQIMVMRWIQDNIKNFNGDPTKVTIDGHSAGAADVGFHIVSPLAKGLFRYAIMQSGSPLAFWAMAPPEWRNGYNINESDLIDPKTTNLKKYLKALDDDTIKEMVGKQNSASFISFPAVVDNHFLIERPLTSYQEGRLNGEAYLMSFTKDEGSVHALPIMDHYKVMNAFEESILRIVVNELGQALFPSICKITEIILHEYGNWEYDHIDDDFKTVQRFIEMQTDFVFIAPMIEAANIISQTTDNIFLFSFDHVSKLAPGPDWLGVPHGRDLFYQFGAPLVGHKLYKYSEHDKTASRIMMNLWGNFVKHGKLKHHPHYRKETKVFNRLYLKNNNITVKEFKNFKPRKMAFWNTFLPLINCPERKTSCQTSIAISVVPQVITISVCIIMASVTLSL